MKPVVIFRHAPTEGPGYFATYLSRNGVPWEIVKIDEGEPVPHDVKAFSGLAFMGGPMSVNDALPWIAAVLDLIRSALEADIPVVGHCLGGQLMARALGGTVTRHPIKEIGWGEITPTRTSLAKRWLGDDLTSFTGFHWHGESFSIPAGAERVLSALCVPLIANDQPLNAGDLLVIERLFTHESVALVLGRNDDDFRLVVDRALSKLYASPEFETLYLKWFGEPDDATKAFFRMSALPE